MPNDIAFPDSEPTYVFDRDCLAFRALVGGKSVDCLVTAELLLTRFGAVDMTEEALRQAFGTHRAEIEALARGHIENGWINEEGCVSLTTRYTRLSVSFDDSFGKWPAGRAAADAAHRMLTGIIGPHAEDVSVEWGRDERPDGTPIITLRIVDPALLPYSIKGVIEPRQWGDPAMLSFNLAGAWGAVLRARSRKLILKSG